MAIGSGLAAQVGFGAEGTWGTAVTVDHFPEFDSETVDYSKGINQGQGLHAGGQYDRAARRTVATYTAAGDVAMEHAFNGLGLLWKHALGSAVTAPSLVAPGVYKQVHQPGPLNGFGLTYQKGVPQRDGTVRPFTFAGGKVTGWTLAVSQSKNLTFTPTFDFAKLSTATALAAASYLSSNGVFDSAQCAIKIGGSVATTSGVAAVTGGTALATLSTDFSLTGANPLKVDDYGLGNAGQKSEQTENGFRTVAGTLRSEFTNRAEIYDLMVSDASTALQVTFTGPSIDGTHPYQLDIVLPAVKFDTDSLQVGGPDVVGEAPAFAVLDDGTHPVIQVAIQNSLSSL